jgi:FkbM family methyltransferase
MSLLLTLYKLSRVSFVDDMPGGWRIRRYCRSIVSTRIFRNSYLSGHAWAHPGNVIGDALLLAGTYEPDMTSVIQTIVRGGFSFIDVGANIGLHTLAAGFARRDSTQRIIAIEPEPATFAMLERNVASNNLKTVTCLPIAVGDVDREVTLHVADGRNQGAHSLLPRKGTSCQVKVPERRLDGLLNTGTTLPSDHFLIKVDVEGSELVVLNGASQWLAAARECAVLIEVFPALLQAGGGTADDLFASLSRLGFESVFVIGHELPAWEQRTDAGERFWNMLFVKDTDALALISPLVHKMLQPYGAAEYGSKKCTW